MPAVLVCAVAVGALIVLYWPTVAAMIGMWAASATYTHGFLVVPVAAWLLWRDRARLAGVVLRPFWPGLALLAAAGVAWLLADLALVNVVRQFALVVMLQAVILTLLGRDLAARVAFPLLFLLFAVPTGDFLLPTLMDWTADFTVAALRATGVPVFREGNHFVIPSGSWSVVEACSGLRYLVASLFGGVLYAYLTYRSPWRRAAFIAAAVAVPIVANWTRAYLIVMLGHLTSNRLAAGVDHFVYGWVFFGAVIFALFWIGGRWREAGSTDPLPRPPSSRPGPASRRAGATAAVATLIAGGVWAPLASWLDARTAAATPAIAAVAGTNGWRPVRDPIADWTPHRVGHPAVRAQAFEQAERRVGIHLASYGRQRESGKLVSSENALVRTENPRWRETSRSTIRIVWNGQETVVRSAELTGPDVRLAVVHGYWIAGHVTADDRMAALLLLWSKLLGQGDSGTAWAIYAPASEDDAAATNALLAAFALEMSGAIAQALR